MKPRTMYKFRLEPRTHLEISLGCFFENHLPDNPPSIIKVGQLELMNFEINSYPTTLNNSNSNLDTPDIPRGDLIEKLDEYREVARLVRERLESETSRELKSLKMLIAHGASDGQDFLSTFGEVNEGFYVDTEQMDIRRWLRKNDSRFDALAICSCNYPNPIELRTNHAVLTYPIGLVTIDDMVEGDNYRTFIPK